MKLFHNILELGERRRELRRRATGEEKILWEKLRNHRIGPRFKRQYSIGGYILDFYCAEKRLIIEIDGGIHKREDSKEYDEVRDKYFSELGYKTLRILNDEVNSGVNRVIEKIKSYL